MKYLPIDSKLFTQNRKRFTKMMKPNSVAIFPGNPQLSTNGDALYTYQPNSDVVWLSGVVQEKTMVILYPDNPDRSAKEVLVVIRPNEHMEKWEGHKLRKEEATAISGIANVQYVDSIDAVLQVMMHHADTVYLNSNENDRLDTSLLRTDLLFVHDFAASLHDRMALLLGATIVSRRASAAVSITRRAAESGPGRVRHHDGENHRQDRHSH